MRTSVPAAVVILFLSTLFASVGNAQGNADWEELWKNIPPNASQIVHPNRWMIPANSYTGIAYDRWRDVLYVVNPGVSTTPPILPQPRIFAWKAADGTPATDIGRSAWGANPGVGAELPVPMDTIALTSGTTIERGFEQNRYCIYKIDLDEGGRIFACNVVNPLWGICILIPPNFICDPDYLHQGPFRVWRWDTPVATPRLVYATLDKNASAIGSINSSEMTYTRWGDAFDVVGGPVTLSPTQTVDSARILVSGGSWPTQPIWNDEVNIFLPDTRAEINRPASDIGNYKLEYRLAVKAINNGAAAASHGVAATSNSLVQDIWMNSNPITTTVDRCVQTLVDPWPQTHYMGPVSTHYLSSALTGESGALRYFELPQYGRKFIIVAGSTPTGGSNPSIPNTNTTARVIDVTTRGSEFLAWTETPQVGSNMLDQLEAELNWIADVDFKLEYMTPQENPTEPGLHLVIFLLMSNNGIAAYRSRTAFPVELSTLRATVVDDAVALTWQVTMESNNHGFEVQRSFDNGRNWEVAGFVPGRGTTTTPMEYRFTDSVTPTHRNTGRAKYRLRQVDSDGSASFSPTVDVYFDATPRRIALSQNYPNPFNPETSIAYQLSEPGPVTLAVYNIMGERVATLVDEEKEAGTHQVTLSARTLPSGTYVYRLSASGQVVEKKMTVMK